MSDELEPFAIGAGAAAPAAGTIGYGPVEQLPPGIWVPIRDGRGAGQLVRLEVLAGGVALPTLAGALGLELEDLLEQVDAWARTAGFTYGVRVDLDAQTITQAGR